MGDLYAQSHTGLKSVLKHLRPLVQLRVRKSKKGDERGKNEKYTDRPIKAHNYGKERETRNHMRGQFRC